MGNFVPVAENPPLQCMAGMRFESALSQLTEVHFVSKPYVINKVISV